MAIEVTPQTLAVIEQYMATGQYRSEADALQAALDERIDPDTGMTIAQLRRELQKGLDDIEAGRVIPAEEAWGLIFSRFSNAQQ